MSVYIGYIGCCSGNESDRIHIVTFDTDTGIIELKKTVIQRSPSFLSISPDQRFLFASAASATAPTSQRGEVVSYAISPDGDIAEINRCASCSADAACHIASSNDGRYVYASHYDEGRAAVYCRCDDGSLFGPVQVIQHRGVGSHPQQDVPHIHFASDTPDGKYVCFVDLALDEIVVYRRLESGLLEKYCSGHTPLASGARHMTFSPDGRFAYVISEMTACVSVYQYNDGRFKYLDTVSMLAQDHTGKMSGSAIHITPDGSLLFAGNRFKNEIVAFIRDQKTGYITKAGHTPCSLPRDFCISPEGKCLCVCASEDNAVEVYRIDGEKGNLAKLFVYRALAPSCMRIMNSPAHIN